MMDDLRDANEERRWKKMYNIKTNEQEEEEEEELIDSEHED